MVKRRPRVIYLQVLAIKINVWILIHICGNARCSYINRLIKVALYSVEISGRGTFRNGGLSHSLHRFSTFNFRGSNRDRKMVWVNGSGVCGGVCVCVCVCGCVCVCVCVCRLVVLGIKPSVFNQCSLCQNSAKTCQYQTS